MRYPVRVRIKASPPCRLVCPMTPPCKGREGPLFDRGKKNSWGWIVRDMRRDPIPNSICAAEGCGRKFLGRNIALEQGAPFLVIGDNHVRRDGSWNWDDCVTLAPDEVKITYGWRFWLRWYPRSRAKDMKAALGKEQGGGQ